MVMLAGYWGKSMLILCACWLESMHMLAKWCWSKSMLMLARCEVFLAFGDARDLRLLVLSKLGQQGNGEQLPMQGLQQRTQSNLTSATYVPFAMV